MFKLPTQEKVKVNTNCWQVRSKRWCIVLMLLGLIGLPTEAQKSKKSYCQSVRDDIIGVAGGLLKNKSWYKCRASIEYQNKFTIPLPAPSKCLMALDTVARAPGRLVNLNAIFLWVSNVQRAHRHQTVDEQLRQRNQIKKLLNRAKEGQRHQNYSQNYASLDWYACRWTHLCENWGQ